MKELKNKNVFDIKFKTIIDLLFCISLIVLSVKKGGFYKEDLLSVALFITILAIILIFYEIVLRKFKYML